MRLAQFLWAALFWMCVAGIAQAQSLPDFDDVYINDFAGLLTEEDAEEIHTMLSEVYDASDIEMVVVTMDRMATYGHRGEIEPFATRLFNHWGVGDADRNDGVMILVARRDRQMRIEVGSGYGRSQDANMQDIIDSEMLPAFRNDNYSQGITEGTRHAIHAVTGVWPGSFNGTPLERFWNTVRYSLGHWIWGLFAGIASFVGVIAKRISRSRPRRCPNDGSRMIRLNEVDDDMFLKDGQITEEGIKSVDYDVWTCDRCEHVTVEAYRSWFRRYGACRSCGFRTLEGDTVTVRHATTRERGLKRRDFRCFHCGDTYSKQWTTRRKSKSSGSGSRSSFDGGRSSGGGASGRW